MALDYREHPDFSPDYNGELPERMPVPIPVCVLGTGEETAFLGFGKIVGSVETDETQCPVIELTDVIDQTSYTLLGGAECIWTYPPPEGVVEAVARGVIAPESVARYIELRTARAENEWLKGLGIDPI